MRHCIVLGEGIRISPAAYLKALQTAMENPTMLFKQSFQDPTGWMGPKTGQQIVAEYRRMIADRQANMSMQQHAIGKGSKAQRRVIHYRNNHAECKWCGQKTGKVTKQFCSAGCARSYNG